MYVAGRWNSGNVWLPEQHQRGHRDAACGLASQIKPHQGAPMVSAVKDRNSKRKGTEGVVTASRRDDLRAPLFPEARWGQLAAYMGLTPRQSEIASYICQGCTYESIALQTGISINTVRMHMRALFLRLGARDRLNAVLHFVRVERALTSDLNRRSKSRATSRPARC